MALFDLFEKERHDTMNKAIDLVHDYYSNTKNRNVTPDLDLNFVRQYVEKGMTNSTDSYQEKIKYVFNGLESFAVQIAHPSYFGLFNPRPAFAGIISDLFTATTNPQLAAWSHNPFCYAVEEYSIQELGKRFGLTQLDGTFCSGGAEANQTAVLCALNKHFPSFLTKGVQSLSARPVLYCSGQTHHSIAKAARMCGIGLESVRLVPTNQKLEMSIDHLSQYIKDDLKAGLLPFMVVATAGTTGPGSIDDIAKVQTISKNYGLWFHVDAAFAGALTLSQKHKSVLSGIEHADSITVDIHKWLAAPMGTGCFITSHLAILESTFRITAEYMPTEGTQNTAIDPYVHSIQWSRRSLGLRFYMSLLFYGWEGFEKTLDHHMEMGEALNAKLVQNDWKILNDTPLPIVCFSKDIYSDEDIKKICAHVVQSKKAWISTYPVNGNLSLRACITNYATSEKELDQLVLLLHEAENELF
jgi:glutamate/tyrosine decarboxylase-like PLP-dependent enzyme